MNKIYLINKLQNSIKFEDSIIKLRNNLNTKNKKVILITSSSAKEGKSQIALSISISMSQIGKKVLLLDTNIRNPNLKNYSDNEIELYSLCDYLYGNIDIKKIINKTNFDNLDFIYAGKGNLNLLDSKLWFDFIFNIKEEYDYVFIDSASCSVPEPFILSKICDGILFVIRQNYISLKNILSIKKELNETRNIIGAVFTKF